MPRLLLLLATVATISAGAAIAQPASRSLGLPWAGTLAGGVQLPAEGEHFFTWDNVRRRSRGATRMRG